MRACDHSCTIKLSSSVIEVYPEPYIVFLKCDKFCTAKCIFLQFSVTTCASLAAALLSLKISSRLPRNSFKIWAQLILLLSSHGIDLQHFYFARRLEWRKLTHSVTGGQRAYMLLSASLAASFSLL